MLTYREFVGRTIGVPPDCQEPFCPFGSKEFGHGWCDDAYSDQCYGCKESLSVYQKRYILGNGGNKNAE
jgi:hypothetical protein